MPPLNPLFVRLHRPPPCFRTDGRTLSPETFAASAEALMVPSQDCRVVRTARRGSSFPGLPCWGQSILSFPGVHRKFCWGRSSRVPSQTVTYGAAVSFWVELVI